MQEKEEKKKKKPREQITGYVKFSLEKKVDNGDEKVILKTNFHQENDKIAFYVGLALVRTERGCCHHHPGLVLCLFRLQRKCSKVCTKSSNEKRYRYSRNH